MIVDNASTHATAEIAREYVTRRARAEPHATLDSHELR
jgi:hypothetical protein